MTTPAATPPPTTAVASLATAIGRYFTVVGLVPGLILVSFTYILARSGAWNGTPDFAAAVSSLTDLSLGSALGLLLVALVVGALLHPIQLATLQFLEGYWGFGAVSSAMRRYGVARQRARWKKLEDIRFYHSDMESPAPTRLEWDTAEMWSSYYPSDPEFLMPTRLGNALRTAETRVGAAVGLDVALTPHLLKVAPPEQAQYVDDQRTGLDLMVGIWLSCVLTTGTTILYLWPHGLYLMLALVPYILAMFAYRGAVSTAREYGWALQVLFDLNRFTLYERLHLPLPISTKAERELGPKILRLTVAPVSQAANNVHYRHPRAGQS